MVLKLRPHHGLCVQFFRGEGYSDEFVENMTRVIEMLNRGAQVELTEGGDCLCAVCPNFIDGVCADEGKVTRYDRLVMAMCGLHYGDRMPFRELARRIRTSIIYQEDGMGRVCSDCQWARICHK